MKEWQKDGFVTVRNFFEVDRIDNLRESAQSVFNNQFEIRGFKGDFTENMIMLFEEAPDVFVNCGKIIQQGLLPLYQMAVDQELIALVKYYGVRNPLICTRPVLFFNHPKLAANKVYYQTPPHQDWSSMQASLNSVVVWIPLVDVHECNGGVRFYPGTHLDGVLPFIKDGGFAGVERPKSAWIQPNLAKGDICLFSTFLVHESAPILDNSIRWSCHFRYTDISDEEFIRRGNPNPYIYKPTFNE